VLCSLLNPVFLIVFLDTVLCITFYIHILFCTVYMYMYMAVSLRSPNESTEIKAKVDSDLVVSTSFSQDILPFMRMSICTLVRTASIIPTFRR
jgi:hypothetical protein